VNPLDDIEVTVDRGFFIHGVLDSWYIRLHQSGALLPDELTTPDPDKVLADRKRWKGAEAAVSADSV
jgi:hypothetical protein